jgi:hypothetical protein
MEHVRSLLLVLAAASACAGNLRTAALREGEVAKHVVDAASAAISEAVLVKYDACAHLEGDRPKLDACLGPVVSRPDDVDAAFEAVRSAQEALYFALAGRSDPATVRAVLADLTYAVRQVMILAAEVKP